MLRACSLWQTTCGVQGSCRIYNRHQLMLYWLGVHIFYKFGSLLCWGGAILTYKPEPETVNYGIPQQVWNNVDYLGHWQRRKWFISSIDVDGIWLIFATNWSKIHYICNHYYIILFNRLLEDLSDIIPCRYHRNASVWLAPYLTQ